MIHMNGQERFLSALSCQRPDRAPVFLRDLTLCLDESGYRTPEVCAGRYDAEKAYRSIMALHRRLGQDAVVGCVHHVGLDIELMGGEVSYPDYGIPSIVRHPFQDISDPELYLPCLGQEGPFPQVLRCYERVAQSLQGVAATVFNVEGPLTKAALLRGLENLIMDLELEPELAKAIIDHAVLLSRQYLKEAASVADLDACFIAAATDNPEIFRPETLREMTIPGLERMVRTAGEFSLPVVFHPHGNLVDPANLPYLDVALETGIKGLQFAENNDPVVIRDHIRGRVCNMGGVDTISTLMLGPEGRIHAETQAFLRIFHPWQGYVFMCSCSLHRGMPLKHVDSLMRSARSFL